MLTKNHHFFLLNYSPWPLISSVSSFNFMFSLLLFFKCSFLSAMTLSLMNMVVSCFIWWFSYSSEFHFNGFNSQNLDTGLKFGMILFISSEVLFFLSFFWAYFHFYLSPCMETGLIWPPFYVLSFDCTNVPLINTILLLSSGVTVTIAHYFFMRGSKTPFNFFLMTTVILGFLFTILQKMEYDSSFFSISDSTYGTIFFMLTGFHGIHVMIGSLFLLTCLIRCLNYTTPQLNCPSLEMSSWYWHFVDVVWIFLYFLIYYLNT